MDDSEFLTSTERALEKVGAALDAVGADVDWALSEGVLTIECEDGSKLIVNRHAVNREIWIAARAGGFHYRADAGRWRDTRTGEEFGCALERLLLAQGGVSGLVLDIAAPPG